MRIEDRIKQNKDLEPYFLWYLKCNFRVPWEIQLSRSGFMEDAQQLSLLFDHERSRQMLLKQLNKYVGKKQFQFVFNAVCDHYINELGPQKIINGIPELFIIQNYN